MVEISIDIPDSIYEQLDELSETFSQAVEETINEVLEAVIFELRWLVNLKKEDPVSRNIRSKISDQLYSARMTDGALFIKILKELNAEGLFIANDMEIDLDDNRIWIYYHALDGSNLFVDSFDVTLTGLKSLSADCIIQVDEDDYETLDKVKEHAMKVSESSELPEEFYDLDFWEIDILAQDETSICLRADFSEESLEYLPSIPVISELFEKILTSAGVSRP
jgi:hypothetical protein